MFGRQFAVHNYRCKGCIVGSCWCLVISPLCAVVGIEVCKRYVVLGSLFLVAKIERVICCGQCLVVGLRLKVVVIQAKKDISAWSLSLAVCG